MSSSFLAVAGAGAFCSAPWKLRCVALGWAGPGGPVSPPLHLTLPRCAACRADNVGLQTGDASINIGAPVVVMTTEILRNVLYRIGAEGSSAAERLEVRPGAGAGRVEQRR